MDLWQPVENTLFLVNLEKQCFYSGGRGAGRDGWGVRKNEGDGERGGGRKRERAPYQDGVWVCPAVLCQLCRREKTWASIPL